MAGQAVRMDAREFAGVNLAGEPRVVRGKLGGLLVVGYGSVAIVADHGEGAALVESMERRRAMVPVVKAAAEKARRERKAAEMAALARIEIEKAKALEQACQNDGWCDVCLDGPAIEEDEEFGLMCAECIERAGFEFFDDNDNEQPVDGLEVQ